MVTVAVSIAAAVVVHEAGHALAAKSLRLPCRPVLTKHGPGISIGSDDYTLSPREIRLTAIAGPLANLLLALVGYRLGIGFLVLANLEFAFVNLLPLRRSDGSRLLKGAA